MSLQMVLLPVFVQVGLTFALLLMRERNRKAGDGFDEFGLPTLFYALIALALPLRHTDLVTVMLAWVFVVTRFVHAGVAIGTKDSRQRSLAWLAGVLVLLAMWLYFALKILLLI